MKILCDYNTELEKFNIKHGLDLQPGENEVYEKYRARWRK